MNSAKPIQPDESQQAVCAKYNLSGYPPEDKVAIALGTLHKSPIYGTRVELPENGTISWFIHCGEYSSAIDFYQPLHTHHLTDTLPEIIKYLFLPAGAKFIIDREGYEDVWMSEPNSSIE